MQLGAEMGWCTASTRGGFELKLAPARLACSTIADGTSLKAVKSPVSAAINCDHRGSFPSVDNKTLTSDTWQIGISKYPNPLP